MSSRPDLARYKGKEEEIQRQRKDQNRLRLMEEHSQGLRTKQKRQRKMKQERNENQKKPAGFGIWSETSHVTGVTEKTRRVIVLGTQKPLAGIMKRSSKHDGGVTRRLEIQAEVERLN